MGLLCHMKIAVLFHVSLSPGRHLRKDGWSLPTKAAYQVAGRENRPAENAKPVLDQEGALQCGTGKCGSSNIRPPWSVVTADVVNFNQQPQRDQIARR